MKKTIETGSDETLVTGAWHNYRDACRILGKQEKNTDGMVAKARRKFAEAMAQDVKTYGPEAWGESLAYSLKEQDPLLWEVYETERKKLLSPEELQAVVDHTNNVEAMATSRKAEVPTKGTLSAPVEMPQTAKTHSL